MCDLGRKWWDFISLFRVTVDPSYLTPEGFGRMVLRAMPRRISHTGRIWQHGTNFRPLREPGADLAILELSDLVRCVIPETRTAFYMRINAGTHASLWA